MKLDPKNLNISKVHGKRYIYYRGFYGLSFINGGTLYIYMSKNENDQWEAIIEPRRENINHREIIDRVDFTISASEWTKNKLIKKIENSIMTSTIVQRLMITKLFTNAEGFAY